MKTKHHYATHRIIMRVSHNTNDYALIKERNPTDWDNREPKPIRELASKLDEYFYKGARVILETDQGFDDEGGNLYQCYIIKPEHKDHFDTYWNENCEKNNSWYYQMAVLEYIINFQDNLITVWAGPY